MFTSLRLGLLYQPPDSPQALFRAQARIIRPLCQPQKLSCTETCFLSACQLLKLSFTCTSSCIFTDLSTDNTQVGNSVENQRYHPYLIIYVAFTPIVEVFQKGSELRNLLNQCLICDEDEGKEEQDGYFAGQVSVTQFSVAIISGSGLRSFQFLGREPLFPIPLLHCISYNLAINNFLLIGVFAFRWLGVVAKFDSVSLKILISLQKTKFSYRNHHEPHISQTNYYYA